MVCLVGHLADVAIPNIGNDFHPTLEVTRAPLSGASGGVNCYMTETQPFCTDDYGEGVYRCHWTERFVWARYVIWTGPVVPNVKMRHAAAPGYEAARRQSAQWFAETEQNCNTCRFLERVKHPKCRFGFLYGKCKNEAQDLNAHPYRERFQNEVVMIFHPDDWMGMPCYRSRWDQSYNAVLTRERTE